MIGVSSFEPLELCVGAGDAAGPNRVEFNSPDEVQTGWVELDGARKPHVVRGALAGALDGITQLTCTAEADLSAGGRESMALVRISRL